MGISEIKSIFNVGRNVLMEFGVSALYNLTNFIMIACHICHTVKWRNGMEGYISGAKFARPKIQSYRNVVGLYPR